MSSSYNPPDRQAARKLVEKIRHEHGYLRQDLLDRLSDEVRREIEEAMSKKDSMIASSVTTLARNLYTSSARFVFELLQNADDNHYTNTTARSQQPSVSFYVYPDRVIMECNEDGFKDENLTAICNVGKSSKTGAQGYIGEKGIGFKSVFMAAYRAHIQSGYFSFFFEHRPGDAGLGMITPVWEENGAYLGDNLTRMTLFLHEGGSPQERAKQRQMIRQQFDDIHQDALLFMKNIVHISVSFYDHEEDGPSSTATYTVSYETGSRATVVKATTHGRQTREEERHYYITKQLVTNLAKNENRTYSKEEETSRAYATGEVVLAFPLTEASDPLIENQNIFAFLPIRKMGFKFLIQADFVTQANRQDIVTTSERNEGLGTAIADTFIVTVREFCQNQKLCYKWMRYLPDAEADGYPWDSFWKRVIAKIKHRVINTCVLVDGEDACLRKIQSSRFHSDTELDRHGQPLFQDITPKAYLSRHYAAHDLARLRTFGLKSMSTREIVARVKADVASQRSRMKETEDEDWHSRAANLIWDAFNKPPVDAICKAICKREIRNMELLPLNDNNWTSITLGDVYYPKIDGVDLELPQGLSLKVLKRESVANASRKRLFDGLGVKQASVSEARAFVMDKHHELYLNSGNLPFSPEHARLLYLTEHLSGKTMRRNAFWLKTTHKNLLNAWADGPSIYIRDDNPYGAAELFKATAPGEDAGSGAPGFNVTFLDDIYFKNPPDPPNSKSPRWKNWLCSTFGRIRVIPKLLNDDTDDISEAAKYVETHRPEKFLGFIRTMLKAEPPRQEDLRAIEDVLSSTQVLCEGHLMQKESLDTTFLPLQHLKDLGARFLRPGEFFPWLWLDKPMSNDTFPPEWEQLDKLVNIGIRQPEWEFVLDLLFWLSVSNDDAQSLVDPSRMWRLYNHLQTYEFSKSLDCRKEIIRDKFLDYHLLFIPASQTRSAMWSEPSSCVWEAPMMLSTKHPLEKLYSSAFQIPEGGFALLASFFRQTLDVPNCTWKNIMDEIRFFRDGDDDSFDLDKASQLYKCLSDIQLVDEEEKEMKCVFETEALIFEISTSGEKPTWHKSPQCLWSSATSFRGITVLNDLYGDLKDFFVKRLGVRTMTAAMVYDKLRSKDSAMSVDDVKETIMAFNSFLADSHQKFDPKPVVKSCVFPVKLPNGLVELQTGKKSFALLNHTLLANDFEGQAKFLDFGLAEVRALEPFILWTGLQYRYLSKMVKENTFADYDSARPVSSIDRDIKCKAHALARIAVTYGSPRTKSGPRKLYELLRNLETLETATIGAELSLDQDGEKLRVEKQEAVLHIRDGSDPDTLTIYLPKDEKQQEHCWHSKLSRCLCEWIMKDPMTQIPEHFPSEAVEAIQSVLGVKRVALEDVLNELGIVSIDITDEEEALVRGDGSVSYTQDEEDGNSLSMSTENQRTPINDEDRSTSTPSPAALFDTESVSNDAELFTALQRHHLSSPRLRVELASPQDAHVPDTKYASLLRQTVAAARRTSFPCRGTFSMSSLQDSLTNTFTTGASSLLIDNPYSQERDKKVGAAGELFVFEVLSNLDPALDGFSTQNWQSNIRGYAASHPDYENIRAWVGRETSDMVYTDVNNTFTRFLADKGYPSPPAGFGNTARYFIEVKTTTAGCATPFYMSRSQFQRMQDVSILNRTHETTSIDVYIIIRVFNLGKDSVSFKVLVDPEDLRMQGELDFTAESWSVVVK